jgi:alkanesulfonate monooxygenase
MTRPDPVFHWFLPTGGDDRAVSGSAHGGAIGATGRPSAPSARPATLEYLTQLAKAADSLGYHGVLTPTGAHCEDAWLVTAALIGATSRLKFLVAFRPGLIAPVLAAQMAATFQRLSGGRLLLNVVVGGNSAEQRGYGDRLDHDERYARADEFLTVLREASRGVPFDHVGDHYTVDGGLIREPADPFPRVYFGGSSDAAVPVAVRHADVYLTWRAGRAGGREGGETAGAGRRGGPAAAVRHSAARHHARHVGACVGRREAADRERR